MQCQSVAYKQLLPYIHGTVPFCRVCLKTENEAKLVPNVRQEMLGSPLSSSSWLCGWCEMRCRSFERLRRKAQSAHAWLQHVRSSPHIVQMKTDYYWTAMQEIKSEVYRSGTVFTSYINPETEEEQLGEAEIETDAVIKEENDIDEYIKHEPSLYQETEIQEVNVLVPETSQQLEEKPSNDNDDDSNGSFSTQFPTDARPESTATSAKERPSVLAEILHQPLKTPLLTSATEIRETEQRRGRTGTRAPEESEGTMFTIDGRTITPISLTAKTKARLNVASGRDDYKLKPGDTTITLDEKDCIMNIVGDLLEGRIGMITLTEEERRAEHAQVLRTGRYQQARHACEPCGIGYQNKHSYSIHMNLHVQREGRTHRCSICTTYYETAAILQRHMSDHYTRYYCCACARTFHNNTGIVNHYFLEHMSVDFVCKYCDKTFRKPYSLRVRHMQRHVRQTSVACDICHRMLSSDAALQQHMRKHNPEDFKWYECPICHKMFPSAYQVKKHLSISHEPARNERIQCQLCHNTYLRKLGLQTHMQRKHAGETSQRYKCDDCGKEFKVKGDMTRHITWTHMRLGGLQCPHCDKMLFTPSRLREHVRHTHERVPTPRDKLCDLCGRGFGSTTQLATHRRIHTGERPYTCAQCGMTFRQNAAMRTHIKLKHLRLKMKKQVRSKKKKDTAGNIES